MDITATCRFVCLDLFVERMEQPKVIFLDAVGTLFGVQGSVGQIYSAIAQQMGVLVSPTKLDEAFYQSFKGAPPLAFPGVNKKQVPELEFQWWEAIARSTFEQVGVLSKFKDFTDFFTQLYAHFATTEPWYIYDDVLIALQHWQEKGIELGIISNFDSRIYTVTELLKLRGYFDSITISSTTGAAKPHSKIFEAALAKHNCSPEDAWHIGDSLDQDYHGARGVGIKAFLLKRP